KTRTFSLRQRQRRPIYAPMNIPRLVGAALVAIGGLLFARAIPSAELAALPSALGVPHPGPTNDAPYAPQPIVQGGVIVPLYAPDSPLLKQDRIREAEQYNLSKSVPGRINSIVNIHNPSIEVHTVDGAINTG